VSQLRGKARRQAVGKPYAPDLHPSDLPLRRNQTSWPTLLEVREESRKFQQLKPEKGCALVLLRLHESTPGFGPFLRPLSTRITNQSDMSQNHHNLLQNSHLLQPAVFRYTAQ